MREPEPNWSALIQDCFERPEAHEALDRFFGAILPYLYAALTSRYSVDLSLIEDAVQSASLKYLTIFQGTRNRPLSVGYFVAVAKNCLIDELRRRKGHLPIDEVAETDLPSVLERTASDVDERMLLIQHAMMQLDSRCQYILESYYIDGVDARKIAEWLKIGSDSVHMAIKRCRDRLRVVLADLTSPLPQASATKT